MFCDGFLQHYANEAVGGFAWRSPLPPQPFCVISIVVHDQLWWFVVAFSSISGGGEVWGCKLWAPEAVRLGFEVMG